MHQKPGISPATQRQKPAYRFRTALALFFTIICPFFSAALDSASFAAEAPVFRIGFGVRNTQIEDARQYLPFLAYLSKATGYRFELRLARKNENIVDLVGTQKVDFAFMGAGHYIAAREKYGVIPLVRGLNSEGKSEYRSAIVVKMNSPLKNINDLRGKTFAFGDEKSTQGHLIPLITLSEHGIKPGDLGRHGFTGSHRNCAQAVLKGEYDAGGLQDVLAKEYADEGLLRILHMSRFYPSSGVVVNTRVPTDVVARVKKAFIDFKPQDRDAKGLYHWNRTEMASGFVAAHDADYAELRAYALQFGLLKRKQQ